MAATLADFRIRFPEFANAPDATITPNLTAALLRIDVETWGALANEGQMYMAAHLLALSPWGNSVRIAQKDGTTTYGNHYDRLVGMVSEGMAVL